MIHYILFFMLVSLSFVFYGLHLLRMRHAVIEVDPFTKELLKTQSPIERRLFRVLYGLNYPVVCQYPFYPYSLDLALPALKIAIEADGKAYHSSPKQKAHDRKRDAFLKSHGWQTLRFSGSQINGDLSWVVRRIEKEIQRKKAPLN
jgi:very-short-patch-repair endonuclease